MEFKRQGALVQRNHKMSRCTYPSTVYRPNFETRWVQGADLLLELLRVRKGVVSEVDVSLEGERKFAMGEELGRRVFVVEPCEERFEGIETAVERKHQVGRRGLDVVGDRHVDCERIEEDGDDDEEAADDEDKERGGRGGGRGGEGRERRVELRAVVACRHL